MASKRLILFSFFLVMVGTLVSCAEILTALQQAAAGEKIANERPIEASGGRTETKTAEGNLLKKRQDSMEESTVGHQDQEAATRVKALGDDEKRPEPAPQYLGEPMVGDDKDPFDNRPMIIQPPHPDDERRRPGQETGSGNAPQLHLHVKVTPQPPPSLPPTIEEHFVQIFVIDVGNDSTIANGRLPAKDAEKQPHCPSLGNFLNGSLDFWNGLKDATGWKEGFGVAKDAVTNSIKALGRCILKIGNDIGHFFKAATNTNTDTNTDTSTNTASKKKRPVRIQEWNQYQNQN